MSSKASIKESILENHQRFRKVYKINETVLSIKNTPVNNVFITARLHSSLTEILKRFKDSIWWNHEAFFFILNENSETGCSQAYSFLYIMWKFNAISVIYLCYSFNGELMLYTYNPYSCLSSKFWNVTSANMSQNYSWTLLEHQLNNLVDTLVYDTMNFDKTRNLFGYNLKSSVHVGSKFITLDKTKNHFNSLIGKYGDIARIVLTHINASVTIKLYDFGGFVDEDYKPHGVLKDQEEETTDFILPAMYLRDYWKMQTYPFEADGFCIASLKHPVSYSTKFFRVFSVNIWIMIILNGIILIAFLKCYLGETICSAGLQCMRIFVGSRYNESLNSWPKKISLILLVYFQLITSSYIFSNLSSLTTMTNRSPAIESFDDVLKKGLQIYGLQSHKDLILNVELRDHYHGVKDLANCTNQLLANKDIACMSSCFRTRLHVEEDDYIHISKNDLTSYLTFSTAPDWPLLSKLNSILLHISETGIDRLLTERHLRLYVKIYKTGETIKSISIANIMFVFWILIIGWLLGIVLLFLEYLVVKSTSLFVV